MSHFSVIVVTAEKPADEILSAALQPFHEYECTGVDDQYVVDVDVTDEVSKLWSALVDVVRKPDGSLASRYSGEFYTKDGEEDFFTKKPKKEFDLPAGCEVAKVPQSELSAAEGETQEAFAKEYGNWFLRDGRYFKYTNPNAKWDWWQVGGRYSGKFAPGYDPETDPNHQETCWLCRGTGKRTDMVCENGCNGCQGKGISTKWPTQWKNTPGNQIRVGDIPWAALRADAVQEALKWFDKAAALTKGLELPAEPWLSVYDKGEAAREAWRSNAAVKALQADRDLSWSSSDMIENLRLSRDEIAMRAARRPITCFAMLHEGKWFEQGKMGWWACVSDERDQGVWDSEVNNLLERLPADHWLTCVDCHI